MQKFVQRCLVKNFYNERSRSTPLDPKLMFWCVSFRSGAFWTVSLLHETWTKRAKLVQLMQMFMPRCRARIFRNECSRSTPLDLKLMFWCVFFYVGAFGTILLLHKLDAKGTKLIQLIQKFVPRCLVRIFCNKHSWSKPLDPKLMFWCVSFRLGAFGTFSLLHKTCCKTRQTGAINAKVSAMMSC